MAKHWPSQVSQAAMIDDLEAFVRTASQQPTFRFEALERASYHDVRAIWSALRQQGLL
jgi:biopolymer transport protein ExbD